MPGLLPFCAFGGRKMTELRLRHNAEYFWTDLGVNWQDQTWGELIREGFLEEDFPANVIFRLY